MDDTIKKTFRISKKANTELDFIRSYFGKSFGETLEIIISHSRLRIDEEVNLKVKDELNETTQKVSFEYLKLSLIVDELKNEIEKLQGNWNNIEQRIGGRFLDLEDEIKNGDEKNYKRIVAIREFINQAIEKE